MTPDIMISNSAITSVPAGSSTVILFDTTADTGTGTTLTNRRLFPEVKRAIVTIMCDVAVTFFHDRLNVGSTTWDTINGSGSGEATTGGTLFERDCLFIGDDTRLKVTTTTAPATWRVSVRLVTDRALAQ
jgi:hypothetical protein